MNYPRKVKKDLFLVMLDYLEQRKITERQLVECLKECIEFFISQGDEETVDAFVMAKMRYAKEKL